MQLNEMLVPQLQTLAEELKVNTPAKPPFPAPRELKLPPILQVNVPDTEARLNPRFPFVVTVALILSN